jgi:group I intron endonuclease
MYIGKSKNIQRRKTRHLYELHKGSHKNIHLQRAFAKYGENNFEFGIIEQCIETELNAREIFYISLFSNSGIGLYNITEGGDGGAMPPDIIAQNKIKISVANKGNPKMAHFGKANGMYGKNHTKYSKYLMSIHSNNKGKNNPMYGKYGKDNPNYGKHHSESSKAKQSKSMIGKNVGNRKYDTEYIEKLRTLHKSGLSYAEIGRQYNKNYQTISNLIRFGLPAQPSKYKDREEYGGN